MFAGGTYAKDALEGHPARPGCHFLRAKQERDRRANLYSLSTWHGRFQLGPGGAERSPGREGLGVVKAPPHFFF
jgi:hypothetical protein